MIKNTRIDLSKESQIRIDAINSIKYTLLLNYEVPTISQDTNGVKWIEKILEQCHECCKGLFGDCGSSGLRNKFFGEFGREATREKDGKYNSPLNYMDEENNMEQTENANLYDMLLHQCIMSSYHAIVTALTDEETVSFYDIVERVKPHKSEGDKKDSRGIHYLVKKRKYCLKTSKFIMRKKPLTSNNERWSTSGAFKKTTDRHLNNLKKYEELIKRKNEQGKDEQEEYNLLLQFSDLWCRICEVNATDWYFEGQNTDWLKKVGRIDKNLFKKKSKDSETLSLSGVVSDNVDGLYAFFLAERLFNINLFYSMLEFIQFIEENEHYNLSNNHMLDILLECKKLPNAFSRQSFLGYAMGKIIDQPESNIDYWFHKDIKRMDSMGHSIRGIETGFQISTWIKQFHLFVNYMSEFIIPIYQWCFLGMLLDSIESIYVEDKYEQGITKEDIHRNHLIKAFELLASYMDKHAIDMMRPVSVASSKTPFRTENLSVLMKHNYEKEYNISKEIVAKIASAFLVPSEDADIELNLKIINPGYFKNSQEGSVGPNTNFSRIQKFYTDLIKINYLK